MPVQMKVISSKRINSDEPITQEEWEKDYPVLLEKHRKLCKGPSLWEFFGGTISIEDREYQVC